MYEYRKLSPAQRKAAVDMRRERGLPLHAPPHFPDGRQTYIITAGCYEHRHVLRTATRRIELQTALTAAPAELHAWVILPNHYHLLATVDLASFGEWCRLLHSRLAKDWNREDNTKGRQVWYRFQDRMIHGERHYFASINYIHANPVKHGYVQRADQWAASSLPQYLTEHGRETMIKLWKEYPVMDYGKLWDDYTA